MFCNVFFVSKEIRRKNCSHKIDFIIRKICRFIENINEESHLYSFCCCCCVVIVSKWSDIKTYTRNPNENKKCLEYQIKNKINKLRITEIHFVNMYICRICVGGCAKLKKIIELKHNCLLLMFWEKWWEYAFFIQLFAKSPKEIHLRKVDEKVIYTPPQITLLLIRVNDRNISYKWRYLCLNENMFYFFVEIREKKKSFFG